MKERNQETMTYKTRGQKTQRPKRALGLPMSSKRQAKPGPERRVTNSTRWMLQIARVGVGGGVTHSESQKCDFKSISKIRLGAAGERLKFQPV